MKTAHLADRFAVMVAQLAGMPPPPPPAIKGRVFRAPIPDGVDPLAEQWDREHAPATAADDGEGDAPD
jgi:hypothetical protein